MRRIRRFLLLAVPALCGLGAAVALWGARGGELRDVEAAIGGARVAGPRLSVTPRHRACGDREGTVPVSACPPPSAVSAPGRRVLALTARAAAEARERPGASALHRAALVDLLWSGPGGIHLDRSISSLERVARLADHPAPALADLSAALLLRAERDQSPRDLLLAIEAAEESLAAEAGNRVALFNRALAVERLGLAGGAEEMWRAYAAVDGRSGWGAEATERARLAVPPPLPAPPQGPDAARAAEFAGEAPGEALAWGLETALGAWGAAVGVDDLREAERWLRAAEAAGARLERDGRDASLADAARAARGSSGEGRMKLAGAHVAYAEAARLFGARRHADARNALPQDLAESETFAAWIRLHHAIAHAHAQDRRTAIRLASQVVEATDSVRYPLLAGRGRWVVGTNILREGRTYEALTWFERARPLLERARAREQEGAVAFLVMETRLALGDFRGTYLAMRDALLAIGGRDGSVWLHNLLVTASEAVAAEELSHVGLLLHAQMAQVASRSGDAYVEAEARLARARLLAALGRTEAAAAEVHAAVAAGERIKVPEERAWFEPEIRLATAFASFSADPARASASLDSVMEVLSDAPVRLLDPLVGRARALAAAGDLTGAKEDLDRAARLLDARAGGVEDAALRRSLSERSRFVWDRLVMSTLAAGHPAEALRYMEQGRASFSSGASVQQWPPRLRPGEGALSYAVIGDTLLVWALRGESVHLARVTVERAELSRVVERTRAALEMRGDDAAVLPELARLYDLLLRPVQQWLPVPGSPLQIVADGEIAAVPFAALLDERRGRFLVEDHPLRFSDRLRRPPADRRRGGGPVLLIADPAFDARLYPGLARLDGAAAEVREVASAYGTAAVLAGEDASRDRVVGALRGAGLVHYAGHAVFDDQRPERSALLLAGAALMAEEVEQMDLRGLRLVVLSACETVRARDGRAGGFAGFAGALLHAGAGGVVGSTWRVEDEASRRLMVGFHQSYTKSGDGAAALRDAQLAMLRSPEPGHRMAAAWAAFRYAGP